MKRGQLGDNWRNACRDKIRIHKDRAASLLWKKLKGKSCFARAVRTGNNDYFLVFTHHFFPSIPSHARSTSLASSGLSRALQKSINLFAPYSLASKTDFSIWSALMPMLCLRSRQVT